MIFCINCGRRNNERPVLRTNALSPDVGVCVTCAWNLARQVPYDLDVQVGKHADEQLAGSPDFKNFLAREAAGKPKCLHCGGFMPIQKDGRAFMWCQDCERERQQIIWRAQRDGTNH